MFIVDILDRLRNPFGLVWLRVAPDHPELLDFVFKAYDVFHYLVW